MPNLIMPQPPSDYLALALARQIIHLTQDSRRSVFHFLERGDARNAAGAEERWREEVHLACAEMHKGSADTIAKLQREVYELRCLMPMPPQVIPTPNASK